jgi:hypothetical protein
MAYHWAHLPSLHMVMKLFLDLGSNLIAAQGCAQEQSANYTNIEHASNQGDKADNNQDQPQCAMGKEDSQSHEDEAGNDADNPSYTT